MLESVKVRHNATKCTNRSKKLVTFWLPALLGFFGGKAFGFPIFRTRINATVQTWYIGNKRARTWVTH